MSSALSILNTTKRCSWARLPTAPGVSSRCVFTAVCVHLGWVKRRAQIPSIGHHAWSYVMSLSLYIPLKNTLENSSNTQATTPQYSSIVMLTFAQAIFFNYVYYVCFLYFVPLLLYSKVPRPEKLASHVFEVDEDADKEEVRIDCIWFLTVFPGKPNKQTKNSRGWF